MIISHSSKFAFFRNPKSGSSTAQFYLSICKDHPDTDIVTTMPQFGTGHLGEVTPEFMHDRLHGTPQTAVDAGWVTLEQLREYQTFAFIREPYARSVSAIWHTFGNRSTPEIIEQMITGQGYQHMWSRTEVVLRKQKSFFFVDGEQVVEAVTTEDFDTSLRYVIAALSDHVFPVIAPLNARRQQRELLHTHEEWMTPIIKDWIDTELGDDIEFYNKVLANDVYKNSRVSDRS